MKFFSFLASVHALLFSPIVTGELDAPSILAKFDKNSKQYHKNPDLMSTVMAPGAVICTEEDCMPYREMWDPLFQGVVKFDYMSETTAMGKYSAILRCHDCIEHADGCHTTFRVDAVFVLDLETGMITKIRHVLDKEQVVNLSKCQKEPTNKANAKELQIEWPFRSNLNMQL